MSLNGNRKAFGLAGASVLLLLLVAGCGVNPDEAPESAGASAAPRLAYVPPEPDGTPVQRAKPTPRTGRHHPHRRQGPGFTDRRSGQCLQQRGAARPASRSHRPARTGPSRPSAPAQADIVDSARPISEAEYRQCIANGIQPVQFQVASDAAVLAIKNETDVGTDCLSFDEVRNIFRAGSTINSWSQVGYGHELWRRRQRAPHEGGRSGRGIERLRILRPVRAR